MGDTISYADLRSAVLERRPHWRKETDMPRSAAGQSDARRGEPALAFRVFSWPAMRLVVARRSETSVEELAASEHEDGLARSNSEAMRFSLGQDTGT
jgi:hypothetical protein